MAKQKSREKLTTIPKTSKKLLPSRTPATRETAASVLLNGETQVVDAPAGPDLSHIAEGLRSYAVPVSELAFMAGNPRKHTEKDIAATTASLKEFGQVELIVVNKRTSPPTVLNGNGRLQAALSMNWSHIAVLFVDLSEERAKALAVTLNRTGELASWDDAELKKIMEELQDDAGHLSLDGGQLDQMLADLAKAEKLFAEPETPATPDDQDQPVDPAAAEKLGLIIECRDAAHQQDLQERLTAAGEVCRPLTFTEKVQMALAGDKGSNKGSKDRGNGKPSPASPPAASPPVTEGTPDQNAPPGATAATTPAAELPAAA